MEEFTKEKIIKLADDLLIGLTDEECEMLVSEFSEIKDNMDLISSIQDIENVEPMSHPYDLYLAKPDEDVEEESLSLEDVLANCSKTNAGFVEVPKVVG